MKNLSDRLKEFISYSRDFKSIRDFERKIGWSYSTVNNLNDNLVTEKQIELRTLCPELNMDWLLTGKGEMINNTQVKETPQAPPKVESDVNTPMMTGEVIKNKHGLEYFEKKNGGFTVRVPLVPFPAYASFIEVFNDEYMSYKDFETAYFDVDHVGKGKYIAFRVTNDSMHVNDLLKGTPSGAEVLGRELQRIHWNDFKPSKYGFILVMKDGIMFKDIISQIDENGEILLHSRNTSPEYKDFKVKINDVHSIYKVIKRTF